LKEEATAESGRGLLAGLDEQAIDRTVKTQLLAESGRGGHRTFKVELDVETGRELAVDDAGELLLAEVLGLRDLAVEGLERVLETLDDSVRGVRRATEVEDQAGAVGAAELGGGHGDGDFLLVRFWAAGRPRVKRVSSP
jgi:hypothetical protein